MTISAKVVAHSRCTTHPVELFTLEVTLPRCLVAQLNTHRTFSRGSASSRAIPVKTMIQTVVEDPYIPVFHQNARGMQPGAAFPEVDQETLRYEWLAARDEAVFRAERMSQIGAAKEDINRLLEAWAWSTLVVSATDFRGFFTQRLPGAGAQHGISLAAVAMKEAMDASTPKLLEPGEWHLPYADNPEDSAAHCARVSYTKQGADATPDQLRSVYAKMTESDPPHLSPLEHQAQALREPRRVRNFRGWYQWRAMFDNGRYEE